MKNVKTNLEKLKAGRWRCVGGEAEVTDHHYVEFPDALFLDPVA